MNTIKITLFSCLALSVLTGCIPRRMTLFSESGGIDNTEYRQPDVPSFVIEKGDAVSIQFFGQDNEAANPFNIGEARYIVDAEGSVTLPVIGKVNVAGKTVLEVQKQLELQASQLLRHPVVRVRIHNTQVTVIGEVKRPGTFAIETPVTLLAALGMAGDMLPNARRDNVLVQRQSNGKVFQYRVNLLTDELFSSPCYYLQKGDVVYVSPRYKSSHR